MNTQQYTQQISNDLLTLPKNKVIEVADFVQFLKLQVHHQGIPISETGLTHEEAFDLRVRLTTFETDWNAPGMEVYDEL